MTVMQFPAKEIAKTVHDALAALKCVAATLCSRQRDYGDPKECFSNIACMWNILGFRVRENHVTPADVALAMIALKLCRQRASSCPDNWIDIAGYSSLAMALEKSDDNGTEVPNPETSA